VITLKIPCDIGSFVGVATFTAQREILSAGHAAVFFRDDMIDLKRKQGDISRNLTILTALPGPRPDELLCSILDARLMRVPRA
jgi:hypothetical protein